MSINILIRMTSREDIKNALRLLEEYQKNKKPEKPREKFMLIRGIPFIISENTSIKVFQVEYLWLRPEQVRKKLGVKQLEKKSRPRMYS